ncbi:MAG: hypothetical protein EXS49_00945 [Candidatus Pacebacteria bacterium]|nr:hypothetical protein [Candidatus Paceibacterota bacterium]
MKIWLDDHHWLPGTSKSTPPGWNGIGSVEELMRIIEHLDFPGIDEMSFDWDLGRDPSGGQFPDGSMAMELLATRAKEKRDTKYWPKIVRVHTTHIEWTLTMIRFAQETKAELRKMFPDLLASATT